MHLVTSQPLHSKCQDDSKPVSALSPGPAAETKPASRSVGCRACVIALALALVLAGLKLGTRGIPLAFLPCRLQLPAGIAGLRSRSYVRLTSCVPEEVSGMFA